eukprot:9576962-Alexandrium_andersonii.AAC.1
MPATPTVPGEGVAGIEMRRGGAAFHLGRALVLRHEHAVRGAIRKLINDDAAVMQGARKKAAGGPPGPSRPWACA